MICYIQVVGNFESIFVVGFIKPDKSNDLLLWFFIKLKFYHFHIFKNIMQCFNQVDFKVNFVENHGDLTLFIAANGEDYLPQKLS